VTAISLKRKRMRFSVWVNVIFYADFVNVFDGPENIGATLMLIETDKHIDCLF
jgi:hypothetical protein